MTRNGERCVDRACIGVQRPSVIAMKPTMRSNRRVVTELPLRALLDSQGTPIAVPIRWLARDEVAVLLRESLVRFVVANVGLPLRWIADVDRFDFWREAKAHVVDPAQPIRLDEMPANFGYVARLWRGADAAVAIVVLEVAH